MFSSLGSSAGTLNNLETSWKGYRCTKNVPVVDVAIDRRLRLPFKHRPGACAIQTRAEKLDSKGELAMMLVVSQQKVAICTSSIGHTSGRLKLMQSRLYSLSTLSLSSFSLMLQVIHLVFRCRCSQPMHRLSRFFCVLSRHCWHWPRSSCW